ncbi:MSMEG_0567/Sll0786 family nitrogen starvation N-acetyltransferase [Conexibacter sp. CPCC 206217]|uniref:MSMEG_0567/Sll0786 family nitrogen starvation N-acetyltransferase n=1 Tax=Conexibacter sp. CPCC 206217 TaxID=3064574 RepID=UPI002718B6E6|nr:MSMEG_0567/Sll0786 family nitrogen starvation N-acetyltransferase [Conexibacter sp. CPCC 206217]MDO8212350.1 GNAT family N-acetyltransferase [Conexibacter sp. CPCC 206217]
MQTPKVAAAPSARRLELVRESVVRPVADRRELAAHFEVRRRIFVEAQQLFERDDRDAYDDDPATLHVVGLAGAEVVGAVRLYRLDGRGLWKGDRLAVLPRSRALQLGADLVRCAVQLAGEAGGIRMVATVQAPNVRFFERLGWCQTGPRTLFHDVEHQGMEIPLTSPSGG